MLDLDAAYDNTKAVVESAELVKGFDARSNALAARFSETMDIPYGKGVREKFDFFPGNPGAGIFVFIHGGYWQMRHKNSFRFWQRVRCPWECTWLRSAIRLHRRRAFRKSSKKCEVRFTKSVDLQKPFWRIQKRWSFPDGLRVGIWLR